MITIAQLQRLFEHCNTFSPRNVMYCLRIARIRPLRDKILMENERMMGLVEDITHSSQINDIQ